MTPFRQPDEWKELFLDAASQEFDVKEQVLQKLHERKKQKEAYRVKKRIGLIVATCLVFGVTSAYAAMKVYELKNDKGEVVVKIDQEQPEYDRSQSRQEILQQVRNSLEPGTIAAIYVAGEDNPDKNIDFVQVPLTFTNHTEMQSKVGSFFAIPADLTGGVRIF